MAPASSAPAWPLRPAGCTSWSLLRHAAHHHCSYVVGTTHPLPAPNLAFNALSHTPAYMSFSALEPPTTTTTTTPTPLFNRLCFSLGLPRECPAAATRGLDVAALAGGYAGVAPRKARVLGLFCRCVGDWG